MKARLPGCEEFVEGEFSPNIFLCHGLRSFISASTCGIISAAKGGLIIPTLEW